MDVSEFLSTGFLKVEDLRAEGTRRAVIADVRPGKFGKPDCEFQDGAVLGLNATNMRVCAGAWGANTDQWVGKEVELYIGETEFNREKRDSVLIRPISPVIPKDQRVPAPPNAVKPSQQDLDDEIPF